MNTMFTFARRIQDENHMEYGFSASLEEYVGGRFLNCTNPCAIANRKRIPRNMYAVNLGTKSPEERSKNMFFVTPLII